MVKANPNSLHLFPLSIGNHIDHILANSIGILCGRKKNIGFYEDQPYVCENALPEIITYLNPVLLPVDQNAKTELILVYKSQKSHRWIDKINMYMNSITTESVERIWFY